MTRDIQMIDVKLLLTVLEWYFEREILSIPCASVYYISAKYKSTEYIRNSVDQGRKQLLQSIVLYNVKSNLIIEKYHHQLTLEFEINFT